MRRLEREVIFPAGTFHPHGKADPLDYETDMRHNRDDKHRADDENPEFHDGLL
jgi:hypothetical protein